MSERASEQDAPRRLVGWKPWLHGALAFLVLIATITGSAYVRAKHSAHEYFAADAAVIEWDDPRPEPRGIFVGFFWVVTFRERGEDWCFSPRLYLSPLGTPLKVDEPKRLAELKGKSREHLAWQQQCAQRMRAGEQAGQLPSGAYREIYAFGPRGRSRLVVALYFDGTARLYGPGHSGHDSKACWTIAGGAPRSQDGSGQLWIQEGEWRAAYRRSAESLLDVETAQLYHREFE